MYIYIYIYIYIYLLAEPGNAHTARIDPRTPSCRLYVGITANHYTMAWLISLVVVV